MSGAAEYVGGDIESALVELIDTLAFDSAPQARRLVELLSARGWTGWTELRRTGTIAL
ncbi:hypothetical protein [Nocardia panacis]|uniref:hypothetical protein n=1 Tax=Nocardia panacis TaxID=2340916 RepID=UPI001939BBEB|nr:hypothetical protein [Nocardia panacis]